MDKTSINDFYALKIRLTPVNKRDNSIITNENNCTCTINMIAFKKTNLVKKKIPFFIRKKNTFLFCYLSWIKET